ncbi:IMPACT family protein [Propioniciclava soli]|uniref:IMPACT family protein n=1 Tax=Propioniciclava soli TaxID=2775081 RepID=UPI001E51DD42
MADRLPLGHVREATLEVKRSVFLARVERVDDEDAARAVVAAARARAPEARHHCSAFIVDVADAQPIERSSDDGEPAGTAGTPMLEVLRGAGLTNVVAVVTRHFGGTLLGTGGLVRAYSDAVALALDGAPRVRHVVRTLVELELGPDEAGRVHGALLARGVEVTDATWGPTVVLRLAVDDPAAAEALAAEVLQHPAALTPAGRQVTEVAVAG